MFRTSAVLLFVTIVCGCAAPHAGGLTAEHEAAMRDSVSQFIAQWAAFQSRYPAGDSARIQGRQFFASDVVYSGDVAPVDPVLIEGYDALTADATRPGWLREFEFLGERTVITPLAPGAAAVTQLYRETFTDTTGAETGISGAALFVLRNTEAGWRIVQFQAAHPAKTDSTYHALVRRFEATPP